MLQQLHIVSEENFNCTIQELKLHDGSDIVVVETFQLHHTGIKTYFIETRK